MTTCEPWAASLPNLKIIDFGLAESSAISLFLQYGPLIFPTTLAFYQSIKGFRQVTDIEIGEVAMECEELRKYSEQIYENYIQSNWKGR
jgi:hypothetical protein